MVKVYFIDEFDQFETGTKIPLEKVDYLENDQCPEIFGQMGLEICFSNEITDLDFQGAEKLFLHTIEVDELEIIEDKIYDGTGYIAFSPVVIKVETIPRDRPSKLQNKPRLS